MTRTNRFVGGVALGYLSMAVMTVVGLWLTPFLLGRIENHEFGLWLITTQVVGYLALMDFGVVALAPREAAYATGRALRGEQDELAGTFARFSTIVRWQMPVTALVSLVAWWAIANRWEELRWPLAVIVGTFLTTFPFRLYQATLQGLQDLAFLGRVQLGAWVAGTMVTVALVLTGVGLFALAAGWVVTQVAVVAASALRLRRQFPILWHVEDRRVAWPVARDLFTRSGWISLAQVGQVFLNGSDLLVLGSILGPAATVPYACTAKLITVLAHHPQLLMQSAAPALAEMRMSASHERLSAVTLALRRAMLILSGFVACIVLAINEPFVAWWVGAHQFAGLRLTLLLIAAMLVRHFAITLIYTLFSFGYERRLSLTALGDGLVTIGVTAALASFTSLGLSSAPIGSLAGVVFVTLPACALAVARELRMSLGALLASVAPLSARLAAVGLLTVVATRLLDIRGLGALSAMGLCVVVAYCVAMWPVVVEPPLDAYVRQGASLLTGRWLNRRPAAADPRP
jgi:O-antigen/teichoic acid export membrane protein